MATITGTAGNDTIAPAGNSAGVAGGPPTIGADSVSGLGGNDSIDGGGGNDTLLGGDGSDTLLGGADNDFVQGGAGNDLMAGGDGSDTLVAGGSGNTNDTLNGGNGDDELRGRDVADPTARFVFLVGAADADTVRGYGFNYNLADYSTGPAIDANLATGTAVRADGTDALDQVRGIRGSAAADTILGSTESDYIFAGNGADSIDAGLGNDFIIYMDATFGVTVDLASGRATDAGGAQDSIAGFESVFGSNFDDRVFGDAGDNRLEGLAGDDTLDGRDGYDTARYSATWTTPQTQGVVANLGTGTATDAWGDADVLLNIEALVGTVFVDDLTGKRIAEPGEFGETQVSFLRGNQGADLIRAPAGQGRFVATDHVGDADADGDGFGVTVDLVAQTAVDGWGATDQLFGIGAVRGSAFRDRLTGNGQANFFRGEAGDDTIVGGGGVDLVSYRSGTAAVFVDLVTGVANDGLGGTDALSEIENAVGSATAGDTLLGNRVANLLFGYGGDDRLEGGRANDTLDGDTGDDTLQGDNNDDSLLGGAGNDSLNGGTGLDTMAGGEGNDIYGVDNAGDVLSETGAGTDLVRSSVSWTLGDGFENLTLLTGATTGTGNALRNTLIGNAAANLLSGLADRDLLRGADGNDTLVGGAGADTLDGGNGIDRFRYGAPSEGLDRILGYVTGTDLFEVSAAGFGGGLAPGALGAGRFESNAGGNATAAATRFVFDTATLTLFYDADGAGADARIGLATLASGSVAASDIQIIA